MKSLKVSPHDPDRFKVSSVSCKLFYTDTDFTDQAYSHVERHAYELFIIEI